MESRTQVDGLQELNTQLLKMGGMVESVLGLVSDLMGRYSSSLFDQIHQIESQINQQHKQIDELCVEVTAKFSPKASDLRRVFSIAKINSDLERMGDQCRNCAYILRDLSNAQKSAELKPLLPMLDLTKSMLRLGLDGLTKQDVTQMKEVLKMDDQVDQLKNQILEDAKKAMYTDQSQIGQCLDTIMLAKNIERIGDHATNIAEDIIYVCTGDDIRHGSFKHE